MASGSVTIKDVASMHIFSSPIHFAENILRRVTFRAGTYQITITNVTKGHIDLIMIDESCPGRMISL
jgi:hypothetical protein